MKNFLKIAALLVLTTGTASLPAQADILIPTSVTGIGPNKFVKRYTLNSFNIATDSIRLSGMGEVESGSVEINEGTNELRLHLERNINCAADQMCIAVMPAPTVITLRIQQMERNICGGLTIIAERNLQLVDGGVLRVEVQDMNGSRCGSSSLLTVMKKIKVVVTEQGLRDRSEVMSVMSGSVFGR